MVNLLSLNLDTDTYIKLHQLILKHNKSDINDFEYELIIKLLDMNITEEIKSIEDRVYTIECISNDAFDIAKTTERTVISALKKIDDIEILNSINEALKNMKQEFDIFTDNAEFEIKQVIISIQEMIKPLEEIINFLETKRKNINIRSPRVCPQNSILNLRRKTQEIIAGSN